MTRTRVEAAVVAVLAGLTVAMPAPALAAPRGRMRPLPAAVAAPVVLAPRLPAPADVGRGFPAGLLYGRLPDGRRAGYYALDGHVHTHQSPDASLHLGDILDEAARTGLDAVVVTDHCAAGAAGMIDAFNRTHPAGPGPLLVLGEEAGTRSAHIGLWNLGRGAVPVTSLDAMMRRIDARSPATLCVLNHPLWRQVGAEELRPATFDPRQLGPKLDAIELWNAEKRFRGGVRAMIRAWEEMLERGLRPGIVSGSDAHHRHGGLGTVKTIALAAALDAPSLVEAARVGRTYLTDDARLELSVAGHGLGETLAAGPGSPLDPARGAWRVTVRAFGRRGGEVRVLAGREVVARGELRPGALFSLAFDFDPRTRPAAERDRDGYLRVEVVRRAAAAGEEVALVSSPVYFDLGPAGDFWAARPRTPDIPADMGTLGGFPSPPATEPPGRSPPGSHATSFAAAPRPRRLARAPLAPGAAAPKP